MSDEEILKLCQRYGRAALEARRKFEGLLPQVLERQLYRKKNCSSIFEFAAKFAGMSKKQVQRALQIDDQLEDKPVLRQEFRSGNVSVNKIAKVAYIATPETDEFWAQKVQILSTRAVETLVRDERTLQKGEDQKSVHVNTFETQFQLEEDVRVELEKLQQKGINVNDLLREFLQKRAEEIEEEKERVAEEEIQKKPNRYVSASVRQILKKEHGDKCSIHWCQKPSQELHHTQRFALVGAHDPRYMAPLCKPHHEIAGAIDAKAWQKRWQRE